MQLNSPESFKQTNIRALSETEIDSVVGGMWDYWTAFLMAGEMVGYFLADEYWGQFPWHIREENVSDPPYFDAGYSVWEDYGNYAVVVEYVGS
jgi:hypothetical protein